MLLSVIRATWRGAHYLCLLAFLTLAFDISKDCGLDYSLWLVSWYAATLALKSFIPSPQTKRVLARSTTMAEPFVIVSLLVLAMFKATKGSSGEHLIWEAIIKGSDPVLTILEGCGTILIIQWSSQVVRRLVNRSDGYQIAFLIFSALVYVVSGFGLYRLYAPSAPELVPSAKSASVIGCCMTLTIILSIIAIASRRGKITDTSLLFAYMVMSMYIAARNEAFENAPTKSKIMPMHSAIEFGPLSIPYLQSLSLQDVEKIVIQALVHLSQLVQIVLGALSPNILISLLYRMGVLVAVSHIAPSLNIGQEGVVSSSSSSSGYAKLSSSQGYDAESDEEGEGKSRVMMLLANMAKPVLLMTHTRILLQHFGYLRPSMALWGWLNSFLCLALYAVELMIANDDAWERD
ncbi:hypothetical protein BGZ72_002327 [Mortierella alpina]|nr:hypothetical protein BGZ72_002327 [Mortierella alpina]